jgi:hypothetical protein
VRSETPSVPWNGERRCRSPGLARGGERGAALLTAVLVAIALSILAGAVSWFAVIGARTSAAARDRDDVDAAMHAGLELTAAALAVEPDLAAVRRGDAVAAGNGVSAMVTGDGPVDVLTLGRALDRRRRRLLPPADAAVWHPYLWGRLGERLTTPIGTTTRDPLVVAWVRGDGAAGLGADRMEVAIEAVGPSGAHARAVAVVRVGSRGAAIVAVWPEAGVAGPG